MFNAVIQYPFHAPSRKMWLPLEQLVQGVHSIAQSSFLISLLLKTSDTSPTANARTQRNAAISPGHLLERIRIDEGARWTYDEWGSDETANKWIDGKYDHNKHKAVLHFNKQQQLLGPLECFEVHNPLDTPFGYQVSDESTEMAHGDEQVWPQLAHFTLMQHSFGNSYGKPYVGQYRPPKMPHGFNHVVLELNVKAIGVQSDRLGIMYLGDTEIWRTSTVGAIKEPGVTWTYRKDMSSFLALWKRPQKLIFDLGNLVKKEYATALDVTLTATFSNVRPITPGRWEAGIRPADVIMPISSRRSDEYETSAFVYPAMEAKNSVSIPQNAYKAIVSIAATGQADEEFWWSNLPRKYNHVGHGDQGNSAGLSAFREVQLYIDGQVAGIVHPFPMVFPGGTAPPESRPIVPLQTFDLREYEIDISPFLGLLSDGKEHSFSMHVVGIDDNQGKPTFTVVPQYWVLSAKIFLWLDHSSSRVTEGDSPEVFLQPLDYHTTRDKPSPNKLTVYQGVHRQLRVEGNITTQNGTMARTWHQTFEFQGGFSQNLGEPGWQKTNNTYSPTASSMAGGNQIMQTKSTYTIDNSLEIRKGPHDYFIEQDFSQGWIMDQSGERALGHAVVPFRGRADVEGSRLETLRRAKYNYRSKPKKEKDEWRHEKGQLLPQAWTWTSQNYTISALGLLSEKGEPSLGKEVYSKKVGAYNEQLVKAQTKHKMCC